MKLFQPSLSNISSRAQEKLNTELFFLFLGVEVKKTESEFLKRLEREAYDLALELFEKMARQNWEFDIWRIMGFKTSSPSVMVPYNLCGSPFVSPYPLLTMYNCLFFPVSPFYEIYDKTEKSKKIKITDKKTFRLVHGLSPEEMAFLAEKSRIVPCFMESYEEYDEGTIKPLLEFGVPRLPHNISMILEKGIAIKKEKQLGEDFKQYLDLAQNDLPKIFGISDPHIIDVCGPCLARLYAQGMRDSIKRVDVHNIQFVCLVNSLPFSQAFGAVLHTECKWTKEVIPDWSGLPREVSLESITRGLKVSYGTNIPLESYLDILDSKTTKAVRSIVQRLLEDPLSRKYSERLSAKIFEVNREVEEMCKSKTAKLFRLVSDMVVYGGDKFIEHQSQKIIKMPKKGLQKIAEWIASKGVDMQARITGKDWAIAQLSKARCKIESCTKEKVSNKSKEN